MKILIFGADGQLGTDLMRAIPKVIPKAERIPLTIEDVDITERSATFWQVEKNNPEVVINAAAFHNVDRCEDEVDRAFAVNALGVKNIAEACKVTGTKFVHISTDYVFNGEKGSPYLEEDIPDPRSIYAISKYAGEQILKYIWEKHFLIRTSGLYGAAGCMMKGGTNFVENMIKKAETESELKVVTDEVLSPTYTLDLALKIAQLIQTQDYGLYHITNQGQCSWHEFAAKIFELLGQKVTIHETTAAEFKAAAIRPKYSVLKNDRLKKLGLGELRPWPEALKAYLIEKGYLAAA